MIFSGFNIAKLFSGFNIFNGEKLGKLLYYLIIIGFCLGVFWKLFIAPTNVDQSSQQAGTITNITEVRENKEDGIFVGIKIGGLKLGLRL
jgi:hypothetical protein